MALFHIIVLALIQGITEFLPISSSAHLILVPVLTDWPDQGLVIDIAVHIGTLGAVMLYFWREMWMLICGTGQLLIGRHSPNVRLVLYLIIATLPVIAAGYFVHKHFADILRSPEIIAWTTLGFGLLLFVADHFCMTVRRVEHMTFTTALFIGLSQVLALLPGTSRSGITMTAARFFGFERAEAARFSLLLSVPTILGAGVLGTLDLVASNSVTLGIDALIAAGLSFVTALVAIAVMMNWLKRATFLPFVLYRMGLGGFLLYWLYF